GRSGAGAASGCGGGHGTSTAHIVPERESADGSLPARSRLRQLRGVGSAPAFFGQGETEEEAFELMDAAWSLGIRTFDTADAYGGGRSEQWIGNWIASRGNRPVIVTKTFNPMEAGADHGLSRARMTRQLESSLDRLRVDAVDFYLAHGFDPDTPLEETAGTFEGLREI